MNKWNKKFILLILIIIISIIFFIKTENRDKFKDLIRSIVIREKSLDFTNRIDLEEEVSSLNLYGSNLVKWTKDNITVLNPDGSISWEKELDFIEPYIYYGKESIYAIDKSNGHIYSMNINGETIFKAQLNESIFGVSESKDLLLVHIKNDDGENIKMLNKTGDIIKIHEELEDNILYYNANNAGDNYSVSTINTSGDNLISQLGIYNFSGEKIQDVDFKNMIILRTDFFKKDVLVLTDTSINYITDGIVKWKRHFPNIKDMYLEGDKILILYDNNFETIGLDGKTIDKFVFAGEYNKIKWNNEIIYLYGKKDIIGVKGDKEILNYEMDKDILGLYMDQSSLYVHNLGEVEIFKLKTK